MIELGLNVKRPKIELHRTALSGWLIPYNHTAVLLNLPPDSARQRLDQLKLGRNYSVWERKWGLILFGRLSYMNTYRPVVVLRLESHGDGTELKIIFVSPGVLLILAWLLAAAGLVARFSNWGAISGMALAALGVHTICCVFCMREQRDIADDVAGVIADALVVDAG